MTQAAAPSGGAPSSPAVRRHVQRWVTLGLVGTAALVAVSALRGVGSAEWWLVLAMAGLTALGEGTELIIRHRETAESITLLEVAVVIALLVLPPLHAVGAILLGIGALHVLRRRSPQKVVFNLGMHGAAASVAGLVMSIDAMGGAVITPVRVALVLVAITAFGVINLLALRGLLARIEGPRPTAVLNQNVWFLATAVLGNGGVGVIAVAMASAYPWLVPLMLTPIIALHLAYRGLARVETLLEEVQSERDLLDRVMAGASDGIALLDGDGTVQIWNPAMAGITGRSTSHALGRPIGEVLPTMDPDGVAIDPTMPLSTLRPDDHPAWIADVVVERSDGRHVPVRAAHTVLFDDRGAASGDVLIVHDLTREREVASMKEDFVARVSHELRTPLTPIRGYAQILVSRGDRLGSEEREDALMRIVERVNHLTRLVDDLLLAARVSSNDPRAIGEVRPVEMDVVPAVHDVVAWFEKDHPERSFPLHLDEPLPRVLADPLRVNQIVTNLLSNACKYSPSGSSVVVRVERCGPHLAIGVADQGPGIPAAEVDRIFERFHRLEPPDRMRTGGIGLGLYIARRLAEAMDGRIDLETAEGRGSTFRLLLPVMATAPDTTRGASAGGAAGDRRARVR